jgi:hypothetical protein
LAKRETVSEQSFRPLASSFGNNNNNGERGSPFHATAEFPPGSGEQDLGMLIELLRRRPDDRFMSYPL